MKSDVRTVIISGVFALAGVVIGVGASVATTRMTLGQEADQQRADRIYQGRQAAYSEYLSTARTVWALAEQALDTPGDVRLRRELHSGVGEVRKELDVIQLLGSAQVSDAAGDTWFDLDYVDAWINGPRRNFGTPTPTLVQVRDMLSDLDAAVKRLFHSERSDLER
ncbi:MAG: hypothetical protein QOC82_2758 [Frankiaceae bacterium]|jgi:hypothetical protein|nr:hypothetical protein [Frankiaceae bacterium]